MEKVIHFDVAFYSLRFSPGKDVDEKHKNWKGLN